MGYNRRFFLKGMGSAALLALADSGSLLANQRGANDIYKSLINVIIPEDYVPLGSYSAKDFQYRLTRAVLEVLQENFSNQTMPVWGKYFYEVDMEKRVTNIIYWVLEAVEKNRRIYPVDPVWILAQIMKESYYYEFAVSRSLAVGICQFIQPTAQSFKILCAGEREAHSSPLYQLPDFAGKADLYYQIRSEKRNYYSQGKPAKLFTLEETLGILSSGDSNNFRREAQEHLSYLDRLKKYDEQMQQAQDDYKAYLLANIEGKNIFDDKDLQFILNFDERFTYKKPAFAMVEMIARGLLARNGNILAAAVGYNAGLKSTLDEGMYRPYGKIPGIEESATYISHVLINHYEISRRMG